MSNTEENPTINTRSGHVLKNATRVNDIPTRMEVNVEATLYSWEVSRILRRDFNLLTSRMYRACRSRDQRQASEIRALVMDFVLQGEYFKGDSMQFERTQDFPVHSALPLRLVSPEATLIYRTFLAADDAMMRYQAAVVEGKLDREVRSRKWSEFIPVFYDLKNLVLNNPQKSNKTAEELSKELGVG